MSGLTPLKLTGIGRFLQTIVMGDMGRNHYDYIKSQVKRWHAAYELVQRQAEDEGLWCLEGNNAVVTYLQQELRRLHRVIEGEKEPGSI